MPPDALQRYRVPGDAETYRIGRRGRFARTVVVFGVFAVAFDVLVAMAAAPDVAQLVASSTVVLLGVGAAALWRVMDWVELGFSPDGLTVTPFDGATSRPPQFVAFADIARVRTTDPRSGVRDFVITRRDGTEVTIGTAASIDAPTAAALAARLTAPVAP